MLDPQRLSQLAAVAAAARLPSVVIDLDAFDRNLAAVEGYLARAPRPLGMRLATKSLRVPALIRRALDRGGVWQGLMCFSIEEARLLAEQGFDDLLVAYPAAQRSDLETALALHRAGVDLKLMVDAVEHVERLEAFLGEDPPDAPLPVVVDLDASLRVAGQHLGVRRSPVRRPADAVAIFQAATRHVRPVGVMSYEAQVAGLPDNNPFRRALNPAAKLLRKRSVTVVHRRRRDVRAALEEAGFVVSLFNGGGTGSLDTTPHDGALTEVTAGSALLCPHLFDYYEEVSFSPSCFFALSVVRQSDPGFVTCAGGGYIASGEPGWDRVPVPVWPTGLALIASEGCGEVQTPLKVSGRSPALGDVVLFRHAKAGEVMERFHDVVLVEGEQVVERAPTYRGLGACFF
jgi:D-serine deaminase-like pyridoxal phosphate-dependent protein